MAKNRSLILIKKTPPKFIFRRGFCMPMLDKIKSRKFQMTIIPDNAKKTAKKSTFLKRPKPRHSKGFGRFL